MVLGGCIGCCRFPFLRRMKLSMVPGSTGRPFRNSQLRAQRIRVEGYDAVFFAFLAMRYLASRRTFSREAGRFGECRSVKHGQIYTVQVYSQDTSDTFLQGILN